MCKYSTDDENGRVVDSTLSRASEERKQQDSSMPGMARMEMESWEGLSEEEMAHEGTGPGTSIGCSGKSPRSLVFALGLGAWLACG